MNTKTVDTEAITQRLDNHPTKEPEHEIFGQVIHSYTRAQAIEDGYLINLTQFKVTREHFKYPVACTNSVWDIIDRAVNNKKYCNDLEGVLHDIFWMSKVHIQVIDDQTRLFKLRITGAGRKQLYTFKIVCGPGDNAEPVLTVMLPAEN